MIEIDRRDGNDVLRMARGKANALDLVLTRALFDALRKLRAESTGALVVTGSDAIFSAGVDLKQILSGGASYVEEFLPSMNAMFRELFIFPRPVVAAVNGHAIAGGCIMALACDWVVMARGEAEIGMPELPVGVPFPSIPLEIVRNAVSPERFPALILRGKTCRPEEALELGMVHEICDPAALADRALEAASRFTAMSPVAFAQVKGMIRQPALDRFSESAETEVLAIWKSPETAARIRGYLDEVLGARRKG
ncbi:MAG: enoyl-CoA hydratase/isomerase family protein [Thermoanaerobaculia bacterium]